MKRQLPVLMLMFLLMIVFSSTGSAFERKAPKESALHECVFVYDVDGEDQTLTLCTEECPEDDGWYDNGTVCGAAAADESGGATGLTSLSTTATTRTTLHKCEYTYIINGSQYLYM